MLLLRRRQAPQRPRVRGRANVGPRGGRRAPGGQDAIARAGRRGERGASCAVRGVEPRHLLAFALVFILLPLQRLTERLAGEAGPSDPEAWRAEVRAIGHTMSQVSACGLGIAAPLVTESLLDLFPEQVDAHLAKR